MLSFKGHGCRINAVTFDKQCSSLISCAEDKVLNIMDVRTSTQIYSISLDSEPLTLTWMGAFLLIGDNDGNLNIWNHQGAAFVSQTHCHDGKLYTLNMIGYCLIYYSMTMSASQSLHDSLTLLFMLCYIL